jgi:ATP-binding cassette subfamily C protein/ATP-binding cassette subfamily C protein LapB
MGLYTSQSGVVAVDNTSIRQTNPIELRKAITYVQAEPSFVHGSIYENLRLVNLNASEFQLEEALKRAGVWADIIELENQGKHILDPLHLDSYPAHLLKRINTARLFLQDCSIMLIDEPDRSLQDSHHTQIIKGLSTFRESATLVIVSNNPRYFDLADHILWMDQGRIREFGRKEEVEKVCLEYLSN